jgi:hypothetical protein
MKPDVARNYNFVFRAIQQLRKQGSWHFANDQARIKLKSLYPAI